MDEIEPTRLTELIEHAANRVWRQGGKCSESIAGYYEQLQESGFDPLDASLLAEFTLSFDDIDDVHTLLEQLREAYMLEKVRALGPIRTRRDPREDLFSLWDRYDAGYINTTLH